MADAREPEDFSPDDSREGPSKTFWEHLEDLRSTLIKMIVTLALAIILSFCFMKPLLWVIMLPLQRVVPDTTAMLVTTEVTGGFNTTMKIALYAGLLLSTPLLLFFLGQFVIPALRERERRMIVPAFGIGTVLFLCGVSLAYFIIIPAGLNFFVEYNAHFGFKSLWTIDSYVAFVSHMVLAFGLCFELPLVVLILAKLGIVSHKFLSAKRRVVIVIIFILAALVTPTTDPLNQTLLAGPMCLLYEACIWIAWFMERKQKKENPE